MMSSLYGDLPEATGPIKTAGSEKTNSNNDDMFGSFAASTPPKKEISVGTVNPAVMMMMAPRVAKKPAPAVVGNASNIALDLAKLRKEKAQIQQELESKAKQSGSSVPSFPSQPKQEKSVEFMKNVVDEYDPMRPNDYDALMKQKARDRTKEDMQRREQEINKAREHDQKFEESKTNSFASKMMKKMGWKEGEGLGKDGKGIAAPLIAQKTDHAAARIVQGAPIVPKLNTLKPNPPAKPTMVFARPGNPTRVLFLTNLVGKGDVDDDLEEEIREEASKYGSVEKVRIFEAADAPDNEAVRIFVCFKELAESKHAHQKFNGRFFGGRTVQARYYDVNRFQKDDLKPGPNE